MTFKVNWWLAEGHVVQRVASRQLFCVVSAMQRKVYTVSGKKRSPPKENAVTCIVYNTIQ